MKIFSHTIKAFKKGLRQRLFYIKNHKKGFSIIFLLPGSLREKLGDNMFFRTLTKNNKSINLKKEGDFSLLRAGDITLKFPKRCFYEGDFFDIIYPSLKLNDELIETLVYKNPYYESEGCYENFGVVLQKGDYVVDAGANIGMFSVIAAKKITETGQVFAFEPLEEITRVLDENIKNNHCTNIIIEKKLLGESVRDVDLYFNLEENYNAASKTLHKSTDSVLVLKQTTLDDHVTNNNIPRIDFIKADIEGAERDMLAGAEKTIKKFKPKLAIRTYHLPDDKEVLYNLVSKFVPEYTIKLHKKTLYAWIEK